MTSHTLKIRELKEELSDNLDPSHCRKSKGRIHLQKVGEENHRKTLFSSHFLRTDVLSSQYNWSLETTFEESHTHLGIETKGQWSDLAIERTTPLLFGLYCIMTLFGHALHPDGQLPLKQAA